MKLWNEAFTTRGIFFFTHSSVETIHPCSHKAGFITRLRLPLTVVFTLWQKVCLSCHIYPHFSNKRIAAVNCDAGFLAPHMSMLVRPMHPVLKVAHFIASRWLNCDKNSLSFLLKPSSVAPSTCWGRVANRMTGGEEKEQYLVTWERYMHPLWHHKGLTSGTFFFFFGRCLSKRTLSEKGSQFSHSWWIHWRAADIVQKKWAKRLFCISMVL